MCDTAIIDGDFVTTVELKRSGNGYAGDFWVSGREQNGDLLVLMRFQTKLSDDGDELSALMTVEEIYTSTLRDMAKKSLDLGGVSDAIYPPETEDRKRIAWLHLELHREAGHILTEGVPVTVRTALEYKLIRSFGHRAATPMIAEFEQISSAAAEKRITLAKAAGLLEKTPHRAPNS